MQNPGSTTFWRHSYNFSLPGRRRGVASRFARPDRLLGTLAAALLAITAVYSRNGRGWSLPLFSDCYRSILCWFGQRSNRDCRGFTQHLRTYRCQLLACLILTFASATRVEAVRAEVTFQGSVTTTFPKTTAPFFIEHLGGENCCGDGYGLADLSKQELKASISSRRPTLGGSESQFEVVALGSDDFSVEGTQIVNGVQVPLSTGATLRQPVTLSITVRLKGRCPPMPQGISGNVTGAAILTVGLNQDIRRFSSTNASGYIPVAADQEFGKYSVKALRFSVGESL
jgi:hypothetical protein